MSDLRRPVQSQLAELAGVTPIFIEHSVRSWASLTFCGERHTIELVFRGAQDVAAGNRFIQALAEHEFPIPGYLVADAAMTGVRHHILAERLSATVELLLLEEA